MSAFYGCIFLNDLSIDNANENFRMVNKCFYSSDLKIFCGANSNEIDVILLSQIEEIQDFSFFGSKVKTLVIPSSVKRIGRLAFCYSVIQEITFPDDSQLEIIDEGSFAYCFNLNLNLSSLQKLSAIKTHSLSFCNLLGFPENDVYKEIYQFYFMMPSIEIPSQITFIHDDAFSFAPYLSNINFKGESNLIVIGKNAFSGSKLFKIEIPKSTVIINDRAFYGCLNLKYVIFNEDSNLKFIGQEVFLLCNIALFYIPKNVMNISLNAFNISSKVQIKISSLNSPIYFDSGCLITDRNQTIYQYRYTNNIELFFLILEHTNEIRKDSFRNCLIDKLLIPKNVIKINDYAFFNCSLKEIEIEENSQLNEIGSFAFSFTNITNFTIPKYVTKIGSSAFLESKLSILNFAIDSQILEISQNAFENCKISTIVFPSFLKIIGQSAFKMPNSLKNISFNDNSQLDMIGDNSFESTPIESFQIPHNVRSIGHFAFSKCSLLKNITFEDNSCLEIIGNYSFESLPISSIRIPSSVRIIGSYAFSRCNSLTEITFAENSILEEIGDHSFESLPISSIRIPSSVRIIGSYAFSRCNSLTEITFAENSILEEIGDHSFESLPISSIRIPSSVRIIGSYAFSRCNSLTEITFAENSILEEIGDHSFESLPISSIRIPSSVRIIGSYAFSRCNSLTEITFAENSILEEIGDHSFESLPISSIQIPSSVRIIGSYAFSKCIKLIDVKLSDNSQLLKILDYAFTSTNVSIFSIPSSLIILGNGSFFISNLSIITFEANSKLQYIGYYAFYKTLIKSIQIPPFVDFIGYKAFGYLKIDNITFLNNTRLIEISKDAFSYISVPTLIIPNVSVIGSFSFSNSKINSILIPRTVNIISYYAFRDSIIEMITFQSNSKLLKISEGAFYYCQLSSITIPHSVEIIERRAFFSSTLENVLIENDSNLTEIGNEAFASCIKMNNWHVPDKSKITIINNGLFQYSYIMSIKIPAKIVKIGRYSFSNCQNLSHLEFENESLLNIIDYAAFGNCNISNLNLPCAVTEIHDLAFSSCRNLEFVIFPSNSQLYKFSPSAFRETKIEQLLIPPSVQILENDSPIKPYDYHIQPPLSFSDNCQVKIIGDNAFYKHSFKSIIIPSSVTKIGEYSFSSKYLSLITFSESSQLIEIGEYAFSESNISSIVIPSSVKTINNFAFYKCQNLRNISFQANSQLENIGTDSFKETTLSLFTMSSNLRYFPQIILYNSTEIIFEIDAENEYLNVVDNIVYSKDFKEVYRFPSAKEEIFINESVEIIGEYAYCGCTMTKITIPSKVSVIKSHSFENCTFLHDVEFSASSQITKIEKYSFVNTCIKDVYLPDSIKFCELEAFDNSTNIHLSQNSNCSNIEFYTNISSKIFIPKQIHEIPDYRFFKYKLLIQVEFPLDSELKVIGEYSFSETGIENISIPRSVEVISSYAFANCLNLTELVFDNNCNLITIGSYSFSKTNIKNIEFQAQNYAIQNYAFSDISSLNNVTFIEGNYTPLLYSNCFQSSSIKFLIIPSLFKNVESGALSYCAISFLYTSEFLIFNNDTPVGLNGNWIVNYTIPSNIKYIRFPQQTFSDLKLCLILEGSEVHLENQIFMYNGLEYKINKRFKFYAKSVFDLFTIFQIPYTLNDNLVIDPQNRIVLDYYGYQEFIQIPDTIEKIASHAFENLSIKAVSFNENIKQIEYHAFYNCSELISVYFPENSKIEYISEAAFGNCPKLQYISDFTSEKYKCVSDTIYRLEDDTSYETIIAHAPMSKETNIDIKSRIIGEASFMCSWNLEDVFINPNTVRQINRYAFFNCTNLKTINFPMCVSSVYEFSFQECNSLENCLNIDNHLRSYLIMLSRSGIPHRSICCINVIDDQTLVIPITHLKSRMSLISILHCSK